MPRGLRPVVVVLLAAALCACSSSKSVFPSSGSVSLVVEDSGVNLQTASTPANQILRWTFESVKVDIDGFGTYDFLGVSPCTYTFNVLSLATLRSTCGGSNLALGTGGGRTATVHLVVSEMEVRRAFRPDLPPSGDYDGDGIANGVDNCPLVPNADQALSANGRNGVACTVANPTAGAPAEADTDGDGIADGSDDCVWVPDTTQADADSDGIGDACQQVARVVLGPGPLKIDLGPVPLTVTADRIATLVVDFDDRKTLVSCDSTFTRCSLNVAEIGLGTR